MQNNGYYAIQGHRGRYQSKVGCRDTWNLGKPMSILANQWRDTAADADTVIQYEVKTANMHRNALTSTSNFLIFSGNNVLDLVFRKKMIRCAAVE